MTLKERIEAVAERDFDRGVSPVIGVILMVAITVVLAAVIGAFVMDLGSNLDKDVNAGAEVTHQNSSSGGSVTVTWISEGSAQNLSVSVKAVDGSGDTVTKDVDSVGNSTRIEEGNLNIGGTDANPVQVIVTAVGEDGTETVVNNKEVTI